MHIWFSRGKNAVRHSISHVLAYAVKRLFPETKLAIGPSIATGFYYDFDKDVCFYCTRFRKTWSRNAKNN